MTDSSWKKDANRRRTARQVKPSDEPVKVPAKSKDTKRWCKGKVGVKHEPKCVPKDAHEQNPIIANWRELVCSKCGKVLRVWYPVPWEKDQSKPAWVTC